MSGSSLPPPLPVAVVSAGRGLSAAAPGAAPAAAEAVVTTPQELAAAVQRGARDIEIRSHLDLTTLGRTPSPIPLDVPNPLANAPTHLMYVTAHTRSIRGNCADPGPAAALTTGPPGLLPPPLPLKRSQCMLVVGDSVMQFLNGTQWLDNVYFRLQRQRVEPRLRVLELGWSAPRPLAESAANVPAAVVYLTNVTVQGQPRGAAAVVAADRGSKLLAQDCIFSDLHGMAYPFHMSYEASIHFVNSAFQNIHVNSAVIEIASGGIVQFNHSTFRNIHTPNDTWVSAASDDGWTFYLVAGSLTVDQDQPDIDVPRRGRDSCSRQFLVEEDTLYDIAYGLLDYHDTTEVILPPEPFASPDDAWIVSTRAALPQHAQHVSSEPPAAPPLPLPGPSTLQPPCPPPDAAVTLVAPLRFPEVGPDRALGGRMDVVPIVVLVLVAVLLLSAAALALFCIKRNSSRRLSSAHGRSAEKVKHSSQRDLDRERGAYLSLSNELQAPPPAADGMSVRAPLLIELAALSSNARPAHPARSTQHAAYFDVRARYVYQLPPGPALRAALTGLQHEGSLPRRGSAGEGKIPAATGASASPVQPHDVSLQLETTATSGGSAGSTQRACTPRTAAAPPGPAPAPDAPQESVAQQAEEGMHAVSGEPHAPLPVLRAAAAAAPSGEHARSQPAARCWGVADYNLQPGTPELHRAARSMRSEGARDTSEVMRVMHRRLNRFGDQDGFLKQFILSGPEQRRCGGASIVQFASSQFDPFQYAIKFYLHRDEFEAEAALLATTARAPPAPPESLASVDSVASAVSVVPVTRQESASLAATPSLTGTAQQRLPFLPDVSGAYDNTAEGVCDPRGRPLPPCIVMQRGESLQDWLGRCTPAWHSACTVLLAVSRCMADMHAAGFVHRGLKPSNIMWLPRANRWHVTDFGRSIATGQAAAADTTLAYCAPELLHAHFEGTALAAAPAQDAWAFGIVAWELLTGSPAFDLIERGPMEVLRAITGGAPLPWEGRGAEMITRKRQLGILQQPVLSLLRREPEGRATIQQFHAACAEATL